MNKIYKVIWSKAKHTYVVASEIAKGHTKGETTGKGLKKLAAAMLVAAALLSPNFAWAADTTKVEPAPDGSATAVEVYTKAGADKAISTNATNISTNATAINTNAKNILSNTEKISKLESAVGDGDSGLKKDVNDLKTTVGDSTGGLVKDVADSKTAIDTEKTAREAGDKALDDRITAVKNYVLKETGDNYVSKADAAVQDAGVVKADKKIGENVTALGKGLYDETAARIGADAAQDKVIQAVNNNLVQSVTTINKNVADGFTALNNADLKEAQERAAADTALDDKITAETSARVAADTKLVEAVNSGVSLSNDNVLQKNTTTIDAQGNVTTSKTDANEMILNKGKDNQITLSENGIKVGTNSTVVDKDGVYTGGDTYAAAKAAMSADGKIKGANGAFTVDENGNVTSKETITGETVTDGKGASMSNGTVTGKTLTDGIATITNGNINTSGTITGGTVTSMGNISALGDIHAGGAITGASASIQGALTAGSATITGDLTAGGAIQGKSISDGTATMQNGNLTGVKNLSAETITTSGDATIGGDLTVKGKLNVDEIDLTKSGIVGDNNVTASTKVAAGEITGYKKATSTKDGSEKESAIDYDENGTSTWAIATDADKKWNKSTLTVEGSDVTSKVIDSDKNSNTSTQTASESNSTITGTADGKNYKSYITQNLKNILQGIKEGTNESIINQTETGIKSTATAGKNTASTNLSNEGFNTYATDGTNKTYTLQTAESLTSQIGDDGKVKSVMNADGITNNADGGTITNSAKDLVNTATGNMTNTVGGKLLNDVTGDMENKVGGNLTTTVTRKVTEDFKSDLTTTIGGNRSEDVKGTSTETVTGKKTENYNGGLETTVTGEEKHTVNGSQTNSITGDQVNTIGGKQTTTVTGDVTEDYKANLSTTVGGSQTTTVTGDSSLSAKNITNKAEVKLSNSAADIENTATKSITDKVGENTSWKMTDGTVVESVKDASGKTNQTTTTVADTYQFVKDGDNTLAKRTSSTNDNLNITDGNNTYTKITTATGNKQTVTDGTETASTNLTKSASNTLIENGTQGVLDHMAADTSYTVMNENGNGSRRQQTASEILDRVTDGTDTSEVKQTAFEVAASAKNISNTATDKIISQIGDGSAVKSEMTADGITNTAEGGTIYNKSKDILNEASGDIINWADGEIGNVATKITNITGDNTVTSDTNGTTFENKAHSTAVKEGTVTKTTISGNTITTGEAVMDYADVMKDLGVRGNAAVDGNTTLGTDGNDTLTVNSTSTFKEKVTMENDLNVKSEVLVNEGDKNQVRINTNGITVGLNSTVVDYKGVYVGGHTFEEAKAGMDKDGKLKAADGNFQVDTKGNVSAVSYTVKDTNIKIDNTGINAGGTKVTGLAPADISHAGSTDAVSGGQLYETNTRVSGLETRMGTVETRVDKLDGKIDKVGANAAAMANLHPLEFDEDSKWNIAAAVGSSGSETASAVGVFYRPNENVMVNASAAMGTGENMFGGGVSLRLGHGGNKAKEAQMKAAAAENKELRAKVDDLTARMDALLSVLNPNMSKDFPDVPENHWAYEAVSRLAGNGIVEGYEDGKYHGERQMTRYEMAEIIYNALSKGAKAEKKLVEEFCPELQAMAAQKKA